MRRGSIIGALAAASLGAVMRSAPGTVAAGAEPDTKPGRIYGYENIRRHLQRHKPDHTASPGSIADRDHGHERANARRVRQAERDRENRLERAQRKLAQFGAPRGRVVPLDASAPQVDHGLSRRGRWVPLA